MVTLSIKGRHDVCIALRVPVVLEAVTAIVLADFLLVGGQRTGVRRGAGSSGSSEKRRPFSVKKEEA
jgi:chorismate synthase